MRIVSQGLPGKAIDVNMFVRPFKLPDREAVTGEAELLWKRKDFIDAFMTPVIWYILTSR